MHTVKRWRTGKISYANRHENKAGSYTHVQTKQTLKQRLEQKIRRTLHDGRGQSKQKDIKCMNVHIPYKFMIYRANINRFKEKEWKEYASSRGL